MIKTRAMGGDGSKEAPIHVGMLKKPLFSKKSDLRIRDTLTVGRVCNSTEQEMHMCEPNLECILNKAVSTFGSAKEKSHPFYEKPAPEMPNVYELQFKCSTTNLTYIVRGQGESLTQDDFHLLFYREIYQLEGKETKNETALFSVFIPKDKDLAKLYLTRMPDVAAERIAVALAAKEAEDNKKQEVNEP